MKTLLTFTGYMVFRATFPSRWPMRQCVRGAARAHYNQLTHWAGRSGWPSFRRYGKYVRITEAHIRKAAPWFERVGHWGLTFGYFIPGVRHVTAYAAGTSEVEPHQFALFAYSGGCLWVATFSSAWDTSWATNGKPWGREVHHYLVRGDDRGRYN